MPETPVVVLGERSYRVERQWGSAPDGIATGFISQVAVDSAGLVYVLQRTDPPVLVFDPDGSYRRTIGAGLVMDGHGIAIDPDDRLFVVDRDAHQVLVFDTDGHELARLGERHRPTLNGPFNHPTDVAVAADGEVYVSDGYGNTRVHRFGADLRHIASWGSPGAGPGEFTTPHAIWVDRRNRVLVADRENDRVQLFARDGGYIGEWRGFYHPMDIWEDDRGMLIVSDQVPRLTMLSPDGRLAGRCRGAINGAHGIWGDPAGNLFMAELPPQRLTRLALID